VIWLKDESELHRVRSFIDVYQCERQVKAREQYAQLEKTGNQLMVIDVIKDNPLRFIIYLAAIVVIVYLSTKPFMDFGK